MRRIFTPFCLLCFSFAFSQPVQVTAFPATATQIAPGTAFTATTTLIAGIQLSDDNRITATDLPAQSLTTTLDLRGFNFGSIPADASILDIDVIVEGSSMNNRARATLVQLTSNGTPIGVDGSITNRTVFPGGVNPNNNPDENKVYGGTDYVFGLAGPQLAGPFFTSNNIGVILQFENTHPNRPTTFLIDNVRIVITYEAAQTPPLPVEFISFDARKADNGVQLTWQVGTEVNVDRYEIERSTNGSIFTKIGSIPATQNSSYSFTDLQPLNGVAYYRVRNVDVDGAFKYTSVQKYNNGQSESLFKAFPTTTKGQVTFQHPSVTGKALITINNLEGRTLRTITPSRGAQSTPVDLFAYPSGTYLLRYQGENGHSETFRIIKQ